MVGHEGTAMTSASREGEQAPRVDAHKVIDQEGKSKEPGGRIEAIPTIMATNDHE